MALRPIRPLSHDLVILMSGSATTADQTSVWAVHLRDDSSPGPGAQIKPPQTNEEHTLFFFATNKTKVLSVNLVETSVRNLIATTTTPSRHNPPKSDAHFSIRAGPKCSQFNLWIRAHLIFLIRTRP
ncbi:MAG: hypothetical protein OXC07_12780, partial [Kistimonas sp.]|nr:hypothetical protein [Kistimonas sp.]